jgi:hypothetical protein
MGKKLRMMIAIFTAILCVALFVVILWQGMRSREVEPVYQDRPLSFWLRGYGNYPTTPTRAETEAAMSQIGTNALPVLLGMLRTADSPLTDKFYVWLSKQHFIKINVPMQSGMKHFIALDGLAALGPKAYNAVPQLIEIYNRNPNFLSRQIVPAILSGIGPPAAAAIPQLLRGTADTNDNVRVDSVFALGRIHAEPELVAPVLIKCLHDPSPDVRGAAAVALGAFGKDAKQAVPALLELFKEEEAKSPDKKAGGWPPGFGWRVGTSSPSRLPMGFLPADLGRTFADALKAIDPDSVTPKWQDGLSDQVPLNFKDGFR